MQKQYRKLICVLATLFLLLLIDIGIKIRIIFKTKELATWADRACKNFATKLAAVLQWGQVVQCTIFPPKVEFPEGNFLLISNHQSIIDILLIIIIGAERSLRFVAKDELKHGFIGVSAMLRLQGHIFVRRGNTISDTTHNIRTIKSTMKILPNHVGIALFPEGHRSEDGNVHPYKLAGIQLVQREITMPIVYAGIASNSSTMVRTLHSRLFHSGTTYLHAQVLGIRYPKEERWKRKELEQTVQEIENESRQWVEEQKLFFKHELSS